MLVHNAKIKIQEEYTRKEKEREVNKRMYVYLYSRRIVAKLDLVQPHECIDICFLSFAVLARRRSALREERRWSRVTSS